MRLFFFLSLICFSQILLGQTFSEKVQDPPFVDIFGGDVAFADVDGDGDPDLIISGIDRSNTGGGLDVSSILYINDGKGKFTRKENTPLEGVTSSSIAFADVDGDNDQDVLISGTNRVFDDISKLYLNDGAGNYTVATGTSFIGVSGSSIAFADVDGDNDPDVLLTGNQIGIPTARLYLNDGTGGFTEVANTPFEPVADGFIAFADVDGDNDQDVLITGGRMGVPTPYLYINDGSGRFTKVSNSPFPPVDQSSIAFADVDGDNDLDVLITGFDLVANNPVAALFTNDGAGGFTKVVNTPFQPVYEGSVAFADVDGDNDFDILLIGINSGNRTSTLYVNDGKGVYSESSEASFEDLAYGSVAFADVDGDSDPDFVITGTDSSGTESTKLYINEYVVSSTEDLHAGLDLDISLYPNPTTANQLNVRYESYSAGKIILQIHDSNGQVLVQQKHPVSAGQQNLIVDIADLSPGIYFVKIADNKMAGIATFIVH